MTNTIAIWMLLLLGGLVAADILYLGWDMHVFVARRIDDLIEYLAFWR